MILASAYDLSPFFSLHLYHTSSKEVTREKSRKAKKQKSNDDQVKKYQVKEEAFPRQLHCKACGQDSGFLIGGTSVVVNPRRLPKKDQAWLK